MFFACGREYVLHSDLSKKHLLEENLKGRNVFLIYWSKALYFLGKTGFDVDSFSYSRPHHPHHHSPANTSGEKTEILWTPVCVCGKGQGIIWITGKYCSRNVCAAMGIVEIDCSIFICQTRALTVKLTQTLRLRTCIQKCGIWNLCSFKQFVWNKCHKTPWGWGWHWSKGCQWWKMERVIK